MSSTATLAGRRLGTEPISFYACGVIATAHTDGETEAQGGASHPRLRRKRPSTDSATRLQPQSVKVLVSTNQRVLAA